MSTPEIALPLARQLMGSADNAFVVAEWRDPGAPAGPPRYIAPLHARHRDDEAWYVLEGAVRVQRGQEIIEARASSGVFVPHGINHTYWNPSPEPTRYLLVMTPNIYALIQGSMRSRSARRSRCARFSPGTIPNWLRDGDRSGIR